MSTNSTGPAADDRMERGLETIRRIERAERPGVLDGFSDVAPGFGEIIVGYAFGDICSRPGLETPTRQLVTVAALTTLGNAAPQLSFHVRGARNVGCTRQDIVETVMHLCPYAGFPATVEALKVVAAVFQAEPEQAGDETTGSAAADDSYERGLQMLKALDGLTAAEPAGSQGSVTDLARCLIEFALGDISGRGGLDARTREIVSIAACTALGTPLRPRLETHLRALLEAGGTEEEAIETVLQMAVYAGIPTAVNGLNAVRDVYRTAARQPA
ncbi:carboxymuconolactone decarboxylase family protein [Streptomyces netropsis]|uniref:carboxymuconolactone decarboxylase family protein n=1 Tax=Streptomyces netropsis TaxID=55404 RepID=UPI0030D2B2E1